MMKKAFLSTLLIHPCGSEGAHDFLGNSANTDLIRQAKGEPGQAPVPTPTLERKKQTMNATSECIGTHCVWGLLLQCATSL